jgi:hypothetical protein
LAGRLQSRRQYSHAVPAFNTETNKAVYLVANGGRTRPDADRGVGAATVAFEAQAVSAD